MEEYSPFIPFIQFDDLSILKVFRKPAGMKLNLVNMNDDLIEAWHEAFSLYPDPFRGRKYRRFGDQQLRIHGWGYRLGILPVLWPVTHVARK